MKIIVAVLIGLTVFVPSNVVAEASSVFSDIPAETELADAIHNLANRGIVQGRPDGTFGPDELLNRAEALTLVVRAVANVQNLPPLKDCFPDVQGDVWFVRPVCYAKDLEWVRGYDDGQFKPTKTVSRAEFLKILLHAYGVPTDIASQFQIPMSTDVQPSAWYFSYFVQALSISMTSADSEGRLNPDALLTRGHVALLMHRHLEYREGRRFQSLLNNVEADVRALFVALDALDATKARLASHRISLLMWNLINQLPQSGIVQVTVLLADALDALTQGYIAVGSQDFDQALLAFQGAIDLVTEIEAHPNVASAEVYTQQIRSHVERVVQSIQEYREAE